MHAVDWQLITEKQLLSPPRSQHGGAASSARSTCGLYAFPITFRLGGRNGAFPNT
ncbi:hypothetical protein MCOR03_009366 [Pyricularia oryzae]|uniref:Uncharacterized protein n=1 Tax=Pyricularia grisea TaxID=148305 RepID=A0ABQ8NWM9_PYRGI|nr:hypothetical protein MCOR33_001706 [Pyricularia grisea]KAI6398967.1 hypothetical protein MCOR23_005500 [Pyricularia oryzae]KAI6413622.1 hypothetical protein MCOR24_006487 [Pyricularia oryzae]KAI6443732.1 hypothetical protein MCOR22_005169 [Pyricularia oryzae]KAI6517983.1 hypothetical protein MCOR10_007141 [Pyricularia oryzae]